MDWAPLPIRNLAGPATLNEFNHAGWFHVRYLAGTSWIKEWAERFGLDTAIQRHPHKVEFELKNNIVIMPEFPSPEQWVIEITSENSDLVYYLLDVGSVPLEPLCVCERYNDRKCRLAFQRLFPNKPSYTVVALQLELHTYITTMPYQETQVGLGQGMMDLIKRRQQMHSSWHTAGYVAGGTQIWQTTSGSASVSWEIRLSDAWLIYQETLETDSSIPDTARSQIFNAHSSHISQNQAAGIILGK